MRFPCPARFVRFFLFARSLFFSFFLLDGGSLKEYINALNMGESEIAYVAREVATPLQRRRTRQRTKQTDKEKRAGGKARKQREQERNSAKRRESGRERNVT